jgi:hypothetical protein
MKLPLNEEGLISAYHEQQLHLFVTNHNQTIHFK